MNTTKIEKAAFLFSLRIVRDQRPRAIKCYGHADCACECCQSEHLQILSQMDQVSRFMTEVK